MDEPSLDDDEIGTIADRPGERIPPDHLGVLITAVALMLLGWGGLYLLVTTTVPRVGQQWLFFLLLQIAVTGTALPFVRYLNVRFTPVTADLPPGGVIVRQSIWIGLFTLLCAWLQILRVLNLSVAFFLAVVLLGIEIFLRSREIRSERQEDG